MFAIRDHHMPDAILHEPVLLNEVMTHLVTVPQGVYVDATFGRGGHSEAILKHLSPYGRLIAFDKDAEAVCYAKNHIHDPRFSIVHHSYANMQSVLTELKLIGCIQGVLFDLGVSSPQLYTPERGFSFVREGKLDMRMDQTQGITAMHWLATVDEQQLATVLWQYGEERYANRIAKAIVAARKVAPIETTVQLAHIIKRAMPIRSHNKHPATRSFQAIRIAINQELTELQQGLDDALAILTVGGRFAAISFHSLEDRLVKQFITFNEKGASLPRKLPVKATRLSCGRLKKIGKPIKPNDEEIHRNPSARSAILRISEKIS